MLMGYSMFKSLNFTPVTFSVRPPKGIKMRTQFLLKHLAMMSFIILISTEIVFAQPDTLWTKTFGGNYRDLGYYVQQTSDGGYIITGVTESYGAGSSDVWLIKTDGYGDTIWTKTFGGIDYDDGRSVQQTTDGGYIIIGSTWSYGSGSDDIWLIKTDTNGSEEWNRTFGGSANDKGFSINQTIDGGYIIAGWTNSYGVSDVWLIKTDAIGSEQWNRTFGGSWDDFSYFVQQTTDGGYIITGYTYSYGPGWADFWLIKTDSFGNEEWSKTFGGSELDMGYSVQQTSDGGYILTGYTESYGAGSRDVWLIKSDATGDTVWTKTFGGSSYEEGYSVQQTTNGGYILTGYTESYGADSTNVWLIKTDALGDTVWTKTIGGSGADGCYSIQQTTDGGYITMGYTESYGAGSYDVWLIRIAPDTGFVEITDNLTLIPSSFLLRQNYPNPFNASTTITYKIPLSTVVNLSIYNVAGNRVETLVNEHKNSGYYSVEWNASEFSSGLYFYQIEAGEYAETKKCLILK